MKDFDIFVTQTSRKPDHYPWAKDFIKSTWAGFWTPDEFSFSSDIQEFKTVLNDDEREIIKKTLSAIAQIEVAVKRFWSRLGDNLPHPSLVDLGLELAHVEVIHNAAYERLLEVLHLEDTFEENLKLDVVAGRVKYLNKYLTKKYENDKKQYVYSLILFTLFIENVSLFSQFYIVTWFNRFKNVLKDTAQQIQYTTKEENLHALAGIKIINTIRQEHPELFDEELETRVLEEAKEAVFSESKIIDWILGDYEGNKISASILKEYISNRVNDSLIKIGFKEIFEINENLLSESEWMEEEVLAPAMTDFFHKRPIEYAKGRNVDPEDLF